MAITLDGTTGITTPDLAVDSDTLFVDAANNRVGIGTSSPAVKLSVQGDEAMLRLAGSGSDFHGLQVQCADASGSVTKHVFIDALNESGAAVANQLGIVRADGGSEWVWATQPAGARIDRRVDRMRIDSEGRVFRPSQPHCFVSLNGGDRTINVAAYGVANGGFIHQNGGFSLGGLLNGFNVVHVPVTGWYRIDHSVYVLSRLNAAAARLIVFKNNAEELLFTQNLVNGDGTNFASKEVFLNANDYINYRGFGRDFSYFFANNHTMLGIHFIG